MRHPLAALAAAMLLLIPGTGRAQGHAADSSGHDEHAMMARHHSVETVDMLVSHRDSLKLTDDQLRKLADLREDFLRADEHHSHHGAMGAGAMDHEAGQAMMMNHSMKRRSRVAFDRVPGKMVPRIHRYPAEHCPSCPFAVLTRAQREQAHQLLESHEDHQHEG